MPSYRFILDAVKYMYQTVTVEEDGEEVAELDMSGPIIGRYNSEKLQEVLGYTDYVNLMVDGIVAEIEADEPLTFFQPK